MAADQEKKIRFSATGNLTEFMQKLQTDAKKLYSNIAEEAKKESGSAKEQNKFISERIRLMREELKLQQQIAQEDYKRLKSNYERSRDSVGEKNFGTQLWKEKMQEAESKLGGIKEDGKVIKQAGSYKENENKSLASSVFAGTLLAGLVRDIAGLTRQFPNAQTGLDFVSPAVSIAGSAVGGLGGSAADALLGTKILGTGAGQTQFGVIGAQMGKELGGFFGDAITRSFKVREEYDKASYGYRAFTGNEVKASNMSAMGYDGAAVANAFKSISEASGNSTTNREANAMLGLERGYGINQSTSLGAFGLERSGGGSGSIRMQKVLGIAIAEGLDRAKFTDVIKSQTALMTEFSQTSNTVNSDQVNRTLFEFNKMGGMFSLGDPRSMGNISAIQSGLSNPNTPFGQAQNYSVLRQLNPNSGLFDLRKMQEQGLQTPKFLESVINDIGRMGGSEDFQKFQMKGRFGNLSYEAIDTLFSNKGNLGSMSQDQLNKMLSSGTIRNEGEENTSKLMRYTAEVSDAFRDNFLEGIKVVKNQFVTEMAAASSEIARTLLEAMGIGEKSKVGGVETKYDSKFRQLSGSDVSKTPNPKGIYDANKKASAEQINELKSKLN